MTSPPNDDGGPSQDPGRGKILQGLAVVVGLSSVGVIALAAYLADTHLRGAQPQQAIAAASILALVALTLAGVARLWQQGARHLAPSGADAMRSDRRPPILYLRSFETERSTVVLYWEQTLARILAEIGPFVAIGKPGEPLPPLGASRFYERHFAHDGRDWRIFVRDMLARAGLVFVVPGATTGLAWELTQCREVLRPERLLILLQARSAAAFAAFRAAATQAGLAIPDIAGLHEGGKDDFIGVLRFKPDWTAYFSPFPPRAFEPHTEQDEHRLRRGLRPVLAQQGFAIREKPNPRLYVIAFAWIAAAVAVFLIVQSLVYG